MLSRNQTFRISVLFRKVMCIGWKLSAAEEWGILKIICISKDEKSMLTFQMLHEDASDCEFGIDIWEHIMPWLIATYSVKSFLKALFF